MNIDQFFMERALELARKGLDAGEFPVGCVIVQDGQIVARGIRNNSLTQINELDHAEMIALRQLTASAKVAEMKEVTVYSTLEPCLMCFSTMLVSGITKYVYGYEDVMGGGTNLPLKMLAPLYSEMEISIKKDVLRDRSLSLFKDFFASADRSYLKDTLLASYTLKQ